MYPRKKAGADPIWNYDELSPTDLIESLQLERALIDQKEFSRAEWFWSRRPKLLCENLVLFFCYLTVAVCFFYYLPQTALLLVVWIGVGASCILVDHLRLTRWRNEYGSSIKRVIVHLPERK